MILELPLRSGADNPRRGLWTPILDSCGVVQAADLLELRYERFLMVISRVLTGRGADIIVIDDPLKPEEALSEAQRQAANEWYDHTFYSRLNDKRYGAIVIVMQRLHEDDLVGHVLGQEQWEVVSFPAIAETDEEHQIETIWEARRFTRRQGEPLHPDREPLDTLDRIRRTIGEYNFAGQYEQSPAPLGGGLVKAEWFK